MVIELKTRTKQLISNRKDFFAKNTEPGDNFELLFEHAPISIWEEDFSEIKDFLEDLKEQGVTDFRTHFEKHEDDLFIVSGLIKVLNINQETLKMFGVKTKEEIPRNLSRYFTSDSLPAFKEEILAFIEGNNEFESQIPIRSLEGLPMILDFKAKILPGYEDNWKKVLVSFIDITKRTEVEKALLESELNLKKSNSAKDKFFNIIAHDLKGPMNAILGFSKLLSDEDSDLEHSKKQRMLGYIYQSAKKSYELFENLLTWSRAQNGTIKYSPEITNLYVLIKNTIEIYDQTLQEKSLQIVNDVSVHTTAMADKNMVYTLFRNIIYNAIKFTPRLGSISIKTEQVLGEDGSKFVQVSVSDTGVGMTDFQLERVFKISENTSTKGTDKELGTGLGLIICKEFVEKHNGQMWIDSEIGHGTTVHFTVPMA